MAATMISVQTVMDNIVNAKKQIAEQEAALGEIDASINSMQGVWEAEDQKAYAERFRDRKRKINDFNRAVGEYLEAMRSYVEDCVAADDQTSRELNSIGW